MNNSEQGRSERERRELDDMGEVIMMGAIAILAVSLVAWAGWALAKWVAMR